MEKSFMTSVDWALVIGILGVVVALAGVYYTRKSTKKENARTISNINLTDDVQVGNLKVDNSSSNYYGDAKIIKDNVFEFNNERNIQVTKDILTLRLKNYFKQLNLYETNNLTLSELRPIEFSENDIIMALKGVEDNLIIEIIGFVNDTQRLPILFEERRKFYNERGFKENTIVHHAQLSPINKNIERTYNSIMDKKRRKRIKKLISNS